MGTLTTTFSPSILCSAILPEFKVRPASFKGAPVSCSFWPCFGWGSKGRGCEPLASLKRTWKVACSHFQRTVVFVRTF